MEKNLKVKKDSQKVVQDLDMHTDCMSWPVYCALKSGIPGLISESFVRMHSEAKISNKKYYLELLKAS